MSPAPSALWLPCKDDLKSSLLQGLGAAALSHSCLALSHKAFPAAAVCTDRLQGRRGGPARIKHIKQSICLCSAIQRKGHPANAPEGITPNFPCPLARLKTASTEKETSQWPRQPDKSHFLDVQPGEPQWIMIFRDWIIWLDITACEKILKWLLSSAQPLSGMEHSRVVKG